jgi:membrane-bound ClpP family serine protease
VVALALLLPLPAAAAEKTVDGLLVQVPTTITTESTGRLRSLLHGPLHRFEQGAARQGGRFVLICDFNPDGRAAACDDFGASYGLATFLRSLPNVHTVAYVHGDVRRHSVLPALACRDLVFAEGGRLGQVTAPGKPLPRVEQTAYEEIARGRFPDALVRKMYDPAVEVVKNGDQFRDGAKRRPGDQPVAGLPPGETALYTFALARDLGLCQQLPSATLDEARVAYGLPRGGGQRVLDRTVCWRVPLDGPVNGELVEQTKRRVERALRARANVLVFEIKCAGGSADRAHELGMYFASLNDRRPDNPVETVAFVTSKARNLATFLAFGCNKIVMQLDEDRDAKDPDEDEELAGEARLGGFRLYLERHASTEKLRRQLADHPERRAEIEPKLDEATAALEEALRAQLAEVAAKQMYPEVLTAGMFNRGLKIHLVERAMGAVGGRALMSDEDFQADQKGKRLWRSVSLVKPWQGQPRLEGRYLTLSARQAKELGVAHDVVKDLPELFQLVGVKPEEVKTVEADWLDGLADFLRDPWTSVILVMVGITCLILELKMPGVGLPGVIAAICFVLFFWSHSQLHGQITWLAILLFVLGLVLIGLEIFVLPGFGVCGISGVLLLLASLGLVAYGHWPRSSEEWVGFGHKIGPFGISLFGSMVMVALVLRYLPHIPVLNRLMSRPAEEDEAAQSDYPMNAELQALLGAIGVAVTPLRPAGKTQFGEAYVDVVAEGRYITPGTRVQVIEVEGNRVVVKEV